jgi:hypothetical protein
MKTKVSFKQTLKAAILASLTALVINIILYYIFRAAGVLTDDIFIKPGEPLTVVHIIGSCIFPVIMASIVFYLIERFTQNGFKIFTIVSVILLLLSFMNPFMGIPGVTMAYAMALNLMHVTVALPILYFIKKEVDAVK